MNPGVPDDASTVPRLEPPTRDWAVAVFVVWQGRVLLHRHPKLGRWLPCGGHVEANELPDEAAVRELLEESGVRVRLVGPHPVTAPGPRPLTRPRGVQLEAIAPGHEHVDLVYWAVPEPPYGGALRGDPTLTWCDRDDLARLPLSAEIRAWARLALSELADGAPATAATASAQADRAPTTYGAASAHTDAGDLVGFVGRVPEPAPWGEGDNIPWAEPAFSARMLREHLSQAHDAASRRTPTIEAQVAWIHAHVLGGTPRRILDLGCGPGLYSERLAALGHHCLGIDVAPAAIAYARERATQAARAPGSPVPSYVLGDVRTADLGGPHDLAMMLFGEFNVFRPHEARALLRRVHGALADGGTLLLEPHTEAAVIALGRAPARWSSHAAGLFSDEPHLLLEESSWNAAARAATVRHAVLDAATARVTRHAHSVAAYDEAGYRSLLASAGFADVRILASLTGDDAGAQAGLCAILARRGPARA